MIDKMTVRNIKQPENKSTLSASNKERILTDVIYNITVDEVSNLWQRDKESITAREYAAAETLWKLTLKSGERGAGRIFKSDEKN